jgi:hypothetical protein
MILKASIDKRLFVGRMTGDFGFGLGIDALDRRNIERRRQIFDDGVEQWLHALVLESRPQNIGWNLTRWCRGGSARGSRHCQA